ncbi:DUF4148 domain-containing protein [Paraburkholderia sp. SOS3]|jgi:hypothetical protein|uniref:DUF4148 domain-containing protein n=1 Tax=Paraburkholderia sp. SOS3 TaxID=1926494 RepID=UPI000947486B|nr:DUF4148 domain-containing protein [Paraburkholderia sp. SOS3]APR39788.1 hypothetical protein BTO02_31905 [Paraburkholderia sp. SOS3]
MKRLNHALIAASLVAATFAAPFTAHASDVAPLTRAQVRAELIAAEQNGTYPTSKVHYPAAQPDAATVYVANRAAAAAGADSAYGGSAAGSSVSGTRSGGAALNGRPPFGNLYRHH